MFHSCLTGTSFTNAFLFVVVFPMDFLEHGIYGKNFAMLGLGDIVIPGELLDDTPSVPRKMKG